MIVDTITQLENLHLLEPYWKTWQKHPNSDFDHFRLVCQLRQDTATPHIFVIKNNNDIRAIIIGRLEQSCHELTIGYLKIAKIPGQILTVLYNGIIGELDSQASDALIQFLPLYLKSNNIDSVVFHQIQQLSPFVQQLFARYSFLFCEKKPQWSTHWAMSLSPELDFLEHKVGGKQRWKIRKRQKDLEAAYPEKIIWHWLSNIGNINDVCESLEAVAAQTYQRALGSGFANDEEHRQRFHLLNNQGALRIQILKIDGQTQAFWIGSVYKEIFYSYETGYAQSLRDYEIGTLVFVNMVNNLSKEGVKRFDFGLGDAIYKQRFGEESWQEGTVMVFAPTPKGLMLRLSFSGFRKLEKIARYLLTKIGSVDQFKTSWRRKLASSQNSTSSK